MASTDEGLLRFRGWISPTLRSNLHFTELLEINFTFLSFDVDADEFHVQLSCDLFQ